MGVAAYNRGSALISRQIAAEARDPIFVKMDELNAMPKDVKAPKPFGPIQFVAGHGGWWAECPRTGFGYWFKTLRLAVRAFNVEITGYAHGVWSAVPR